MDLSNIIQIELFESKNQTGLKMLDEVCTQKSRKFHDNNEYNDNYNNSIKAEWIKRENECVNVRVKSGHTEDIDDITDDVDGTIDECNEYSFSGMKEREFVSG